MPISFISQWEVEAAKHVELKIDEAYAQKNVLVRLWADAFRTNENPNKRMQVFLGHQKTERTKLAILDDKTIYSKRFFIELRVEIFTLKNHQAALDLIEFILDNVLIDFKPFYEFSPFILGDSGLIERNEKMQSWLYQADGYTEISSDVTTLTPIVPILPEPKIVKIGLYNVNSANEPDSDIDEIYEPTPSKLIGGFKKN